MPTNVTGYNYDGCNDECTNHDQHINCNTYNRSKNFSFWTEEPSQSYDGLYMTGGKKLNTWYTEEQCKDFLRTPFKAFRSDNIVAVTWKGKDTKSKWGKCWTYTKLGESCRKDRDTINNAWNLSFEDKSNMARATTDFGFHALESWFR